MLPATTARRAMALVTGLRRPLLARGSVVAPIRSWRGLHASVTKASENTPAADLEHRESHTFQAETSKLLNIVASSLYSEREVFVRELISNASDALEKLRYIQATGQDVAFPETPLEITIEADQERNTLIISDTGIGMNHDELVSNLGTIARSGSKEFMESLADGAQTGAADAREKIIGQFGVGFYSGFMVAEKMTVYTQSHAATEKAWLWESEGLGSYTVAPASQVVRGTRIELKLRDDAREFADAGRIKDIIKKYSNFVGFPVKVNNEVINSIQPLWTLPASSITPEQHEEFYRFIGNSYDTPQFVMQYSADAPLMIRSLLYTPTSNPETFLGPGQVQMQISLYCRKVLISNDLEKMFPSWMRFVKGVVDSEDIPLNLSREMLQDSALIRKIGNIVVGRYIKHLESQIKEDRTKFEVFFSEFHRFLMEGMITDYAHQKGLSRLLMAETSTKPAGAMSTLSEYIERMPEGQKEIYYVIAKSREAALASPYMEMMKHKESEVLIFTDPVYDLVLRQLNEFEGKEILSVESSRVESESEESNGELSETEAAAFKGWLKMTIGDTAVREIKTSSRLVDTPAIIVDHDSVALRQLQQMQNSGMGLTLPPQVLSINLKHDVVKGIHEMYQKDSASDMAALAARQLFVNAQIAAGLVDDAKNLLPQLSQVLQELCRANGQAAQ
ncbi:uncharacterized protein MONBRDRAFT_31056 [Monosiga brevicollis MX1]|uniref:Histidine kinase/HSP90-like ATPase domain-containing protein n=1 Tax=Monosiga brevicollis TaxID=81824 RepID=A9UR11_MONBE|nr:uncharacterized protein MONBRDRAFT_31056 [Monosiga brevicollis MX1]EDQ92695.1 predicted protein [Monosiga brevicollis MX1]|eukprot:XP_001742457.1 hypothetical protein [Monosiga brevicollis MX1]